MTGQLLAAVDGGNSKTDVVLLHSDGTVVGAVRGAGSNPHSLGLSGALDLIGELIDEAWRRGATAGGRRPPIQAGAFFLAGADQADEVRDLHDAIAVRRWTDDVLVGNDTLALLWAGSASGFGVAVVVGAGVNGIGRAPSGREAHFGALGAVTGDWGGGFGIGLAALGAAVRGEEGRGAATALSTAIAGHFAKHSASTVAVAIHRGEVDGDRLAELPALVFDVADRGDTEALAIVDRQADEVVGFAVAALRRSGQTDDATQVVLGGSVIAAAPERLIDRVRDGVTAVAPRAEVVVWRGRPVVGAAIAVLNHHGSDEAARLRLRADLTEERITTVGAGAPEPTR
jgi:N-acetylglucosamine kinase-like BadF-type ATPase